MSIIKQLSQTLPAFGRKVILFTGNPFAPGVYQGSIVEGFYTGRTMKIPSDFIEGDYESEDVFSVEGRDSVGFLYWAYEEDKVSVEDILFGCPAVEEPKKNGIKYDDGKAPVDKGFLAYFPRAILEVARISQMGSKKYTWGGWKTVEDGLQRYRDAEARHVLMEYIEGETDKESEMLHAAHRAWNAMAQLELLLIEREKN